MSIEKADRIGELLTDHLKEMVFDELSDQYLEKAGVLDILNGVPVPIRKTEMSGITVLKIALNMAYIIGVDPGFKYKDNYIQYILRNFDKNFANGLIAKGLDEAQDEKFGDAIIYFRGAMQVDPDNAGAYYCYGRALKDQYEKLSLEGEEADLGSPERANQEEIIGRYKAESLEAFEVATEKDPEMADAYYYLGYAYLNMGLYIKTRLVWEKFMELSSKTVPADEAQGKALKEGREDIELRLRQLEEPVKIEEGYNLILTGKFDEGIRALKPYTESRYSSWWPLWHYLGTAYRELAKQAEKDYTDSGAEAPVREDEVVRAAYEEALKYFLQVLKLSPSNKDAMEEVLAIYRFLGDEEKIDKYTKKIAIIEKNAEADRELMRDQAQRDAGITRPVKMN